MHVRSHELCVCIYVCNQALYTSYVCNQELCQGLRLNAGAVCIAPSRTFVHESIHDKFVAKCKVIAEKKNALLANAFHTDVKTNATLSVLLRNLEPKMEKQFCGV